MTKTLKISGVGCCLTDYLYNNISFTSEEFSGYLSKKEGDGGLTPGELVFADAFEQFTGQDVESAIRRLTGDKEPDMLNIGGPGIVALIHAAQMLDNTGCTVKFYGARGNDQGGEYLRAMLEQAPVDIDNYRCVAGNSPSTVVLSDPAYNQGAGERIFINTIGAAGRYIPDYLDNGFYNSDVVVFGGTALVPAIHDNLTTILIKAKAQGCITVVNTVYDFRNQKAGPDKKWPLGESDESYRNIDLLLTNHQEALRLSGKNNLKEAIEFFHLNETKAVMITNGAGNIWISARQGGLFRETLTAELPVSEAVKKELETGTKGDTTGCGDNFAGGAIASLVMQLQSKTGDLDLKEAAIHAIVSGGFTCFYMGGTYMQKEPGEKQMLIQPYYEQYLKQIDATG